MKSKHQLELYEPLSDRTAASSTFADNMSLGIHRWFRYSAGFSAEWVSEVLSREKVAGRRNVLDPFAGSGTTILEAQRLCMPSVGLEAHPLVLRVARAKLLWRTDVGEYQAGIESVLSRARSSGFEKARANVSLLERIFTPDTLESLLRLRGSLETERMSEHVRALVWLTLCSILRECSTAGTAQWQYVLPNKSKARVAEPFGAFQKRALLFSQDMTAHQGLISCETPAAINSDDARLCGSVPDASIDLVLTSPPYANNFDYADATRIEMTFLGEVEGWGSLHGAVRKYLIRSCSQHAVLVQRDIPNLIADPKLRSISAELKLKCDELAIVREGKGGKKPYHAMIAAYFSDMAAVLLSLRRVTRPGGRVCFVIGDSAPYGVYIPVERWLGELACSYGFNSYAFDKTRDRNIKWKNRKHTVPLKEGRLWIEG